MNGFSGVFLDFLPEIVDEGVHGPRRRKFIISPNLVQDHFTAHDSALMKDQELQETEFFGRQIKVFFALGGGFLLEIDRHISERIFLDVLGLRLAAAKDRSDPGKELFLAERLEEIVIRAELEPQDSIDLVFFLTREDNDRRVDSLLPEHPANIQPAQGRKHQVQDDQVDMFLAGQSEPLFAIGG